MVALLDLIFEQQNKKTKTSGPKDFWLTVFQGQVYKGENDEGKSLQNFWFLVLFFGLRGKRKQTRWSPFQLEEA